MPGYGIWMYLLNFVTQNSYGVIFGDILISCLTVYVIYLLCIEIFKSEMIAKIAAIIFAVYPFSIFSTTVSKIVIAISITKIIVIVILIFICHLYTLILFIKCF